MNFKKKIALKSSVLNQDIFKPIYQEAMTTAENFFNEKNNQLIQMAFKDELRLRGSKNG